MRRWFMGTLLLTAACEEKPGIFDFYPYQAAAVPSGLDVEALKAWYPPEQLGKFQESWKRRDKFLDARFESFHELLSPLWRLRRRKDFLPVVAERLSRLRGLSTAARSSLLEWLYATRARPDLLLHNLNHHELVTHPHQARRLLQLFEKIEAFRLILAHKEAVSIEPGLADYFSPAQPFCEEILWREKEGLMMAQTNLAIALSFFLQNIIESPEARLIRPSQARPGEFILALPDYQLFLSFGRRWKPLRVELRVLTDEELLSCF